MWIAAIYAARFLPPPAARALPKGALVAAVIGLGVVASATQVLRGAHFVSHTLLTAAVCWAIAWTLALAWPARTGGVT
jgi:membrane-associated PAP2 superfamily phosphatase